MMHKMGMERKTGMMHKMGMERKTGMMHKMGMERKTGMKRKTRMKRKTVVKRKTVMKNRTLTTLSFHIPGPDGCLPPVNDHLPGQIHKKKNKTTPPVTALAV
jgi:hypothetical protein